VEKLSSLRCPELPLLQNLFTRGQQNGLQNLKTLPGRKLKEYEPHVTGLGGIFVLKTGIVDYKTCQEVWRIDSAIRAELHLGEQVIGVQSNAGKTIVITQNGL